MMDILSKELIFFLKYFGYKKVRTRYKYHDRDVFLAPTGVNAFLHVHISPMTTSLSCRINNSEHSMLGIQDAFLMTDDMETLIIEYIAGVEPNG